MSVESSIDADSSQARSRRARFREWRNNRPFAGGILLCLAGIIIGWVPYQFVFELMLVGGSYTFVGVAWAIGVFLTGVFTLYRPDLSTIFGVVGVILSILSLLGALGGLFLGMILGIIGGNLCVAWSPPDAKSEGRSEGSNGDQPAVRTDGGTRPQGDETPEAQGVTALLTGLMATVAVTKSFTRFYPDESVFAASLEGASLDQVRKRVRYVAEAVFVSSRRVRSGADPRRIVDAARSDWTSKRLVVAFALLVVTSGTLTLVGTIPATALFGDDDRTTYTVDVGEIQLGEGGQICASSADSNSYDVTITDATLIDVTIYQQRGGEAVKTTFPRVEINDALGMRTNSESERLGLLATTLGCTQEDQTSRTIFQNTLQSSSRLTASEGVTMMSVESANGTIPEPGGFQFIAPKDNETSPADNLTDVDNVTGEVEEVAGNVDDVLNNTLDEQLLNDTGELGDLNETVDRVNETVDAVDETVNGINETVGAVNETADAVDETVGGVNETVGAVNDTVDHVDRTLENASSGPVDAVNATNNLTNGTGDVVSSVDESVKNTTRRTTDGEPPENVSDAVDETTDAVDNTTEEVTGTTDDVTDATDEVAGTEENRTGSEVVDGTTDAVDGTTETVENTTDGVTDVVDGTTDEVVGSTEEVVPSTTETSTATTTTTETATETDLPVTETVVPTATPEDTEDLPSWFDQVEDDEEESVLNTIEETDGDVDDVANVTEETSHLSEDDIESEENITQLDNGTVLLLNGTDPLDIDWGADLPIATEIDSITDSVTGSDSGDDGTATETESDSDYTLLRVAG